MEVEVLIQHYEKEINRQIDIIRGIDCVNLSIGANNIEDFAWIENNIEQFKERSLEVYNRIVSFMMGKLQMKLYFLVYEEKDFEFTAVEKHLGIRHRFKNISLFKKTQDVYLSNKIRYTYIELRNLNTELFSILQYGTLIFLEDGLKIAECLEGCMESKNIFSRLYSKGYLIANFRNFWSEGNSLVFYALNKHCLDELIYFAKKDNFV